MILLKNTFVLQLRDILDEPYLWMPALISFVVVLLLVPVVIQIAKKLGWADEPNERKVHVTPIPRLGGIAIFIGLIFSFILFGWPSLEGPPLYLLAALGILFLTGLRDDASELKPLQKVLMQFVCASIIFIGGFRIVSLEGIAGVHHLPVIAQYLLTIFIVVGITNAFNLIDGIDGLAAGLGFLNALIIAGLAIQATLFPIALLNLSLAGALLAFLVYNFYPARIFMGDTGAMLIGFILSVSAISIWKAAPSVSISPVTPWLAGMFIVPVFDTLRIILHRLFQRRSPFSADKNHVHHLLLETGVTQRMASIILYMTNLLMVALAIGFSQTHASIIVISLLVLCAAFLIELITFFRLLSIRYHFREEDGRMKAYHLENHLIE